MSTRFRDLKNWYVTTWNKMHPGPRVRKGAAIAVIFLVAILSVSIGGLFRIGLGFLDAIAGALLALGFATLVGLAAAIVVKVLSVLPRFLTWTGLGAAAVFVAFIFVTQLPPPIALALGFGLVFVEAILGGAVSFVLGGGLRGASPWRKSIVIGVIVLTLSANLFLISWLISDGDSEHLAAVDEAGLKVPALDASDPSQPGRYEVSFLTYGSGDNHRRPEFGELADLETEAVDGGPFLEGNEGWRVSLREWYWGFDLEHLPVNGSVWFPVGDGPFPLVLIVHGNHDMAEYSDPGYAYLGELFASRGFITVSVDENFLNGAWMGGLEKENDARGWILLQHLKVWRAWNRNASHPFFGKVDMTNIGLIGHSRGGEAVYIAGCFNRLKNYPDDATVTFDFDFDIRGIISIAPVDGQYKPADQRAPLKNVNYLVLQGGHDADVSQFNGARMMERLRFTDGKYWFKTSLFTYRSNHGQFNTVWGRMDFPRPLSRMLNLRPLLDGDDQRRLGKVYMSAFLETSLHRDEHYLPMFRDHRRISRWLPEDIFVTSFEDSRLHRVATYEEDVDVTTATLKGATLEGDGLAVWREQDLELRKKDSKEDQVAYIGWHQESSEGDDPASYSVTLPSGLTDEWRLDSDSVLVFSLADADEDPSKSEDEDEEDSEDEETEENEDDEPPDLTVELVTAGGIRAGIPLSRFRSVPQILRSRFTKLWNEQSNYGKDYEPALQTFELPLASFCEKNPELDMSSLARIRLVFDRSEDGVIIIDDIGFSRY